MWVDTPVKTPAWRRRHSCRACFPDQGRGGPPRGALSAHHGGWGARATRRSSRRNSVHKCPKMASRGRFRQSVYTPASPRLSITSQQCTQMPRNGSERPFSPICVHSCVPTPVHNVATVYTNAPKRLREAVFADLCTLLRRRRLGGDAHAALAVTQPPTHTNSRSLSKLQGTRLGVWSVIQLSNEFAACVAVTHAASRYSWTTTTSPMSVRS